MVTQSKYDNKAKQQWRGWVWNNIKKRLTKHAFDARVLYLAGDGNYDMDEGLKRGFKRHNMIAVDVDEKNVKNARRMGCLGLHANVHDALAVWPNDFVCDAIVLDYCCGFTTEVGSNLQGIMFSRACGKQTVVVVNMQRGRDNANKHYRFAVADKKRQRHAYVAASTPAVRALLGYNPLIRDEEENQEWHARAIGEDAELQFAQKTVCSVMNPIAYSYRPHVVWMDTVVMNVPGVASEHQMKRHSAINGLSMVGLVRQLAALKAVNTRKTKRR